VVVRLHPVVFYGFITTTYMEKHFFHSGGTVKKQRDGFQARVRVRDIKSNC
jgi:hypothetical protein